MGIRAVEAVGDWTSSGIWKAHFFLKQLGDQQIPIDYWRRTNGPRAILLPGVWEPWGSLTYWADALYKDGWDVHFVPEVDLQFGPIATLAAKVEPYLVGRPVVIAHSKGGLVAKQCLINNPDSIRGLIAVCTPFHGAPLSRLMPRFTQVGDLSPENETLRAIGRHRASSKRTVLIESQWDQDVPTAGWHEAGSYSQVPVRGHNAPLYSPAATDIICKYADHIRNNWD